MVRKYEPFAAQTARRIARVCSDRKRGLQEIANALGREPGSLTSMLDKMLEHGDLSSDAEGAETARGAGTLFWVTEAQLERAERAAAQAYDPGLVREEQRLLVLRCPSAVSSLRVLRSSMVSTAVVWAARVDGDGATWLLALDPEAGPLVIDQIDVAAEEAGGSVSSFTASSIMNGTDLGRYVRALTAMSSDIGK